MVKLKLSIDGLLKLAELHGMTQYTTAIGPGANGLTCVCRLLWGNEWQEFSASMEDAKKAGTGTSRVWEMYPERMLVRFAVGEAIRLRLKAEVEALER